jgi:ribosomal-protein-alanine N-acetyltransferase
MTTAGFDPRAESPDDAEVRIVPMRAEHIDAVMPFEREMFGPEAWTAGGYRSELADHRFRRYLVAEDADGVLLGWAGVRVVADEAEVLTVGVVPAARRRGIATILLRALIEEAVRRRASAVFLEVRVDNAGARALYAREGFVDIGLRRGYYDSGRVDAVTMRRDV